MDLERTSICKSRIEDSEPVIVEYMGTKMLFHSNEFAQAFEAQEATRKKKVWAYYAEGFSSTKATHKLGLSCEKSVQKLLKKIAVSLGIENIKDMFHPSVVKTASDHHPKTIEKKLRQNESGVTPAFLLRLIESQEHRCALSGVELKPEKAELDHKIPYQKGGKHEPENVQWLSKEINRMKGTMTNERFIELCKKVAAWNR